MVQSSHSRHRARGRGAERGVRAAHLHPPGHTHLTEHSQTTGPALGTLCCTLSSGWRQRSPSERRARCQHPEAPGAAGPCSGRRCLQAAPAIPLPLLLAYFAPPNQPQEGCSAPQGALAPGRAGCEGGRQGKNAAELRQMERLRGRGASLLESAYSSSPRCSGAQQERAETRRRLYSWVRTH